MYHGSKRAAEIERLSKADVVLTTYSTLENEWRKHATPCKVTCSYCRKQFYPERLRVHLKCAPFFGVFCLDFYDQPDECICLDQLRRQANQDRSGRAASRTTRYHVMFALVSHGLQPSIIIRSIQTSSACYD